MPDTEQPTKPVGVFVRVSPELRKRIRIEAAEQDMSMSQVISSALMLFFSSPKGAAPKRSLKRR